MRKLIATSILGLLQKSAGPVFGCSELMTLLSAVAGSILDGSWKQMMEVATAGPKECPCKTCELMLKLMVVLDELRTATRDNQLTTMADVK